jgi:hypothetical protein
MLSRNPERSWIEKRAHTTLCWDIYPHEPRTPSLRTPNDLSERGPGSLPVWLLPQCDGRRFCLSLRHEFGIFYAVGPTENEFKSNP